MDTGDTVAAEKAHDGGRLYHIYGPDGRFITHAVMDPMEFADFVLTFQAVASGDEIELVS